MNKALVAMIFLCSCGYGPKCEEEARKTAQVMGCEVLSMSCSGEAGDFQHQCNMDLLCSKEKALGIQLCD